MKALFLFLLLPLSAYSQIIDPSDSPIRKYEQHYKKPTFFLFSNSAEASALPLAQLDLKKIPALASELELQTAFERFRDQRFSELDNAFPRRAHWFYPDDGCYSKAALGAQLFQEWGYPAPAKVFIFGDLAVSSPYSRPGNYNGKTYWWYHVAPAYRVGDSAWIFDPTTEQKRPLPIAEWFSRTNVANDSDGTAAICGWETYVPRSSCEKAYPLSKKQALNVVSYFLTSEWDRLVELNINPNNFLGENPPWKEPDHFIYE